MRDPCFNLQCGSFMQRFLQVRETLVEQQNTCYDDCYAPFNLLYFMVVHIRNVCELGGIGRCG